MYFIRTTDDPFLFWDETSNDFTYSTSDRTGYETDEEALRALEEVETDAEVVWIP
jgi:hypothetical protein